MISYLKATMRNLINGMSNVVRMTILVHRHHLLRHLLLHANILSLTPQQILQLSINYAVPV